MVFETATVSTSILDDIIVLGVSSGWVVWDSRTAALPTSVVKMLVEGTTTSEVLETNTVAMVIKLPIFVVKMLVEGNTT